MKTYFVPSAVLRRPTSRLWTRLAVPLLLGLVPVMAMAAPETKVKKDAPKAAAAPAKDVRITPFLTEFTFSHRGKKYTIERVQDQENAITGGFAKTSRKCPPFCVHEMVPVPGVTTVGELELLEFIKNKLERNTGLLVDARTEEWYKKGTIPGSVNIPFTAFELNEADPKFAKTLESLGARRGGSVNFSNTDQRGADDFGQAKRSYDWDFSHAKELLLFCNGVWCDQSPRAIRALVKVGYPTRKLHYYRGGVQEWLLLGFNVIVPEGPKTAATGR